MSQENVERMRATFEAFIAGDRDFGAGLLHPDVEWDASEFEVPGVGGVYHGIESVRQFWREWLSAWETVQFEYQLVDAGTASSCSLTSGCAVAPPGSSCRWGSTRISTRSGTGW